MPTTPCTLLCSGASGATGVVEELDASAAKCFPARPVHNYLPCPPLLVSFVSSGASGAAGVVVAKVEELDPSAAKCIIPDLSFNTPW